MELHQQEPPGADPHAVVVWEGASAMGLPPIPIRLFFSLIHSNGETGSRSKTSSGFLADCSAHLS